MSGFYGIGKTKVIKALQAGKKLPSLSCVDVPLEKIVEEATSFIGSCYGYEGFTSMSALRHQVWVSKMGNNKLYAAPELKVLPLTSAAFLEHTKRAHLQVAIWKASLCKDPLKLNPTEY